MEGALYRLCRRGVILRTERPIYEVEKVFRGRAGVRRNTRGYHLYLYMPGRRAVRILKLRFVAYDKKLRSERGLRMSKAELIREFLIRSTAFRAKRDDACKLIHAPFLKSLTKA